MKGNYEFNCINNGHCQLYPWVQFYRVWRIARVDQVCLTGPLLNPAPTAICSYQGRKTIRRNLNIHSIISRDASIHRRYQFSLIYCDSSRKNRPRPMKWTILLLIWPGPITLLSPPRENWRLRQRIGMLSGWKWNPAIDLCRKKRYGYLKGRPERPERCTADPVAGVKTM